MSARAALHPVALILQTLCNPLRADTNLAEEQMTVEYQGDPIDIGFNAVYLLEAIKHIETERLRIAMNHPERAAVITPVHGNEEAKIDYTAVIMPLRLH